MLGAGASEDESRGEVGVGSFFFGVFFSQVGKEKFHVGMPPTKCLSRWGACIGSI